MNEHRTEAKYLLKDKVALITGGDRGIGKSIVQQFSDQGARVAYTYYERKKSALNFERELIRDGKDVMAIQLDLSNRKSIQTVINKVQTKWDSISILVNNAAIAQEKPFESINDSDWDTMLKINLRGPFICCQEVLPGMIDRRWGRIINIVSLGGQWGGFNQVHYAVAKAGLINLTRSIAKIYSRNGITCNAVSPGLAATDMARNELNTEAGREKVKNIPIGRVAMPEEVASIVLFLASCNASYITGQTINVNGGMYFT